MRAFAADLRGGETPNGTVTLANRIARYDDKRIDCYIFIGIDLNLAIPSQKETR